MPRKTSWDHELALELRAQGLGYSEIAEKLGMSADTISWWFKYAKSGPHETPGPKGHPVGGRKRPPKAEPEPVPKPGAEWDDEKRRALIECATQAVERTGMSLGACAVELGRMLRERKDGK